MMPSYVWERLLRRRLGINLIDLIILINLRNAQAPNPNKSYSLLIELGVCLLGFGVSLEQLGQLE